MIPFNLPEKVRALLELSGVGLATAFSVMLVSPPARKAWVIMLGSAIFGVGIGYASQRIPLLEQWSVAIAVIATVTAPGTIMKLQNKSLDELVKEWQAVVKKKK